jgi:transcriptional regulator with XRE-family HTH domain
VIETPTIGARIALARDTYRLSQSQLGANLGVTRAAVSQYEQDKIRPRPRVIDRLAEMFNSDPEWFERGSGKGPDVLDVPVTIPEINIALLTLQAPDPRELHVGRHWRLPSATFEEIDKLRDHMVAILAPNDAAPILAGDRVLIDTRRHRGAGVFLFIDPIGVRLSSRDGNFPSKARIIGRAIGYLRTL